MKLTAAAIACVAMIGVAIAQTTAPTPPAAPAAPAAPVPPSACPAYPPQPPVPMDAAAIRNTKDLNTHTATVNAYLQQYQTVHSCRVDEARALEAQTKARYDEAKAGQAAALDFRGKWQAVGEAVNARGASKKNESRTSSGSRY
jgi:hypothetical protein